MNNPRVTQLIPVERVERLIHLARGEKVLLDADLARLYGVTTGNLNKAVKRNQLRFPPDFMFQLTDDESAALIFQFGRSNKQGGRRHNPFVFTEQGVAMLSSVLRSERAVQVNVAIMRAFVSLRRMLASNDALSRKLAELERRLENHDDKHQNPLRCYPRADDATGKAASRNGLSRQRRPRDVSRAEMGSLDRLDVSARSS
jgi:hypothetical protein